jgi:hypothetical protein
MDATADPQMLIPWDARAKRPKMTDPSEISYGYVVQPYVCGKCGRVTFFDLRAK